MVKRKSMGEFEMLILTALLRLGRDAYGIKVCGEIEDRAGRSVSIGAVYATLDRLEQKGLVQSRKGSATPERGGKAKRYYEVNEQGIKLLQQSLRALNNMAEGII